MQDFIEKYKDLITDLKGWVAIDSKQTAPTENAPFGEGVKKALEYGVSLGKKFGFDVKNYDNYMGEIIWGEGEEIGIIGHSDIVPCGEGWNTNPFELTLVGDKLYGRGTTDDKGPTLACLYAMKYLKDEGFVPNKKIRFFIGCNEESGWGDVAYFNTVSHFPKYGFSPDGDFPVVYAEKGITRLVVKHDLGKDTTVSEFTGGTVVNAVCGKCSFKAKIDEKLLKKYNLVEENGVITSIGKTAHGSMPEKGKNAILPALKYLAESGENVQPLITYLFDDALGIKKVGGEAGYATISPDLISQEGTVLTITVDFRIPAGYKQEYFIPMLDKSGLDYTATKNRDPLYVPKDNAFVQTLINAYNNATGKNEQPVSQNGGTFASVFEMGCAFGPETPNVNNCIHEPNEFVTLEQLDTMVRIYKQAIKDLCK